MFLFKLRHLCTSLQINVTEQVAEPELNSTTTDTVKKTEEETARWTFLYILTIMKMKTGGIFLVIIWICRSKRDKELRVNQKTIVAKKVEGKKNTPTENNPSKESMYILTKWRQEVSFSNYMNM